MVSIPRRAPRPGEEDFHKRALADHTRQLKHHTPPRVSRDFLEDQVVNINPGRAVLRLHNLERGRVNGLFRAVDDQSNLASVRGNHVASRCRVESIAQTPSFVGLQERSD